MKKQRILYFIMILFLSGCQALNYQTAPNVLEDCDYATLQGDKFILGDNHQQLYYSHVYVANSRASAKLDYQLYQGLQGKLTNEVLVRYYPEPMIRAWHSPFRDNYYDDFYDYFYLTPKQREDKLRRETFAVRKAILQNCEIIYIQIDPLAQAQLSLDLLPKNEVTLIN